MRPEPPSGKLFLVLASQRAFETFVGPVPARHADRFRFVKPRQAGRVEALLPDCRVVISKSYLPARIHRVIFAARRMGVPTLLVVDGPLEWSNLHHNPSLARHLGPGPAALYEPIVHDGVAGIGEAQVRWLASRNAGREIEMTTYANRRIRTAPAPNGLDDEPTPDALDFLVTTARTPYFGPSERRDLIQMLVGVSKALSAGGHRYALRLLDEALVRALRAEVSDVAIDTAGRFADALARTRCVIGAPSSVLLEAMLHDKPTATLVFRDSPLFYQTGWLLAGQADLEASFRSMLDREPERMALQRDTLRQQLSGEDFFEYCDRIRVGEALVSPRPIDVADLELENRALRRWLGWRARLLAPWIPRRERASRAR